MRRLLLVVVLVACNASTPPAPVASKPTTAEPAPPAPAPPPAPLQKGHVTTETMHSDALGVDKEVRVYLPGGYDTEPSKHWPVYYYLHGITGNETNWVTLGKIDQVADSLGIQAIIVMPDGDDGFYIDSDKHVDYDACMKDGTGLFSPKQPHGKTCIRASKYETYIMRDLIGWVDRKFRTIPTKQGRGIAGLSMGGFGALMLAFRHPDMFAATASHSGVDALLYAGPFPYEKGKVRLLENVEILRVAVPDFGDWLLGVFGTDLANWRAHDPAALVDKLRPGDLKIYLDCGSEDGLNLHNGMQYLHDLLLARHIDHEYYLGPGIHNFTFWAERVPKSLAFLRASVAPAR